MIKSIDCGATKPLTALSFMNDGVTVAVGTVDGDIMVYDLRVGDSPTRVIKAAHGDAVKCIAFQQKSSSSRKRSASTTPAVAAGATTAEASVKPASSTLKTAVINAANAAATVPVTHASPHRATASDIPSATSTPMQATSPRVPLSEQPGATRPPYNNDGGPSHAVSPHRFNGAAPQPVLPSPELDQGAYISEVKSTAPSAPSSFQPARIATPTIGPIGGSAGGPELTLQERIQMRQSQIPSVHLHHANGGAARPPSPVRVSGYMPNHQPAPPAMAAEATPNAFSAYQADMKSMIEDSLAGFRTVVHRDIHNMHIDMIRQFQIQKVCRF